MMPLFITIRILDLIDIFLVAFLMYQVYQLIKRTVALDIFIGLFAIYALWVIVRALDMQLLGSILGQIIGVGVIALIVVFQQEIRKFLLIIGTRYFSKRDFSIENFFAFKNEPANVNIPAIVQACVNMSKTKTGALIVIAKSSQLGTYADTGDLIDAETSNRLIESIFAKGSPLHDGAVIIEKNKIHAARCVLPSTQNENLPPHFGMRHRAALGISEVTDAIIIIVSEETGKISLAKESKIRVDLEPKKIESILSREFKD